ncbi:exosortase K [Thermodesulfobacteriota bacterium]
MLISKCSKIKPDIIKTAAFYIVALFIAVGFKYHYSRAGSDDLGWILGPTAGVVETISGIRFEKEDGAGYVNQSCEIIIAPSCAGVNFLIIAFCMAAFSGLPHLRYSGTKVLWLGICAASAYLLTITVNAFRIIASIYTIEADIHYQWMTPERLHRIEGIFIYFLFLCLFYSVLRKTIHLCNRNEIRKTEKWINKNKNSTRIIPAAFIPFFWYGLFSMGIPFFNHAYHKNGPLFIEHCLVILSVCLVVFLLIFLIQLCCRRIGSKIGYNGKYSFYL